MRQLRFGDVTLVALTDAVPPPADWLYAFPAHVAEFDAPARLRWAENGLFETRFCVHALVQDGAVTLVDAGLGPGPSSYFGGLRGRLDAELAAAGLDATMVTRVLFTHFHLDHVGWASREGQACFPNASYHAPEAELAHWRSWGERSALPHHVEAFDRAIAPLLAGGMVTGLQPGCPVPGAPALAYRAVPGHTAGHCGVVLDDGVRRLAIAGDAWHSPAQIERPDWGHRADADPAAAAASRQALACWAHEIGAVIAAGHFPERHGFGTVEAAPSGGFRWEPLG
ncbi:MBL fold metallo-hydrolase [Salinarimonas soli]|nr:MBL fold metallo-hydrolase [Salinarimonas soli]